MHPVNNEYDMFNNISEAPLDRRLFLQRFLLGGAAALGANSLFGILQSACAIPVSFNSEEEGIILGPSPESLSASEDYIAAKSNYVSDPVLAHAPGDRVLTAWTSEKDAENSIMWSAFHKKTNKFALPMKVPCFSISDGAAPAKASASDNPSSSSSASDPKESLKSEWYGCQPQIAVSGDHALFVWTETNKGQWRIVSCSLNISNYEWSSPSLIATSLYANGFVWRPELIALPGGKFAAAWEETHSAEEPVTLRLQILEANGAGEGKPIVCGQLDNSSGSVRPDSRRPALAINPAGDQLALVFDHDDGNGSSSIRLAFYSIPDLSPLKTLTVSSHPASNLAPSSAFSPNGKLLWIAWHANESGEDQWDIPRWFRLRAYDMESGGFFDPAAPPVMRNLEKRGTDQGFEFARVLCAKDGSVCILGRPSHRFCLQILSAAGWSPLYRFPIDSWGGRGRIIRAAFDDQARLWTIRRDIALNALDVISGIPGKDGGTPKLSAAAVIAPKALRGRTPHYEFPVLRPKDETETSTPKSQAGKEPKAAEPSKSPRYNFYFGDLHQHSAMSDGMGEVDEPFRRAREVFADDFVALTDHDHFVSRKMLHSEYEEQKALVEHFYDPGKFVTFFAQEWTTGRVGLPKGFGHKNLYSIQRDHPLFDHKDERYEETPKLFAELRKRGMIAIPHHTSWTGVDWENHDPEIQPLMEICSVHGVHEYKGNTPIPHRGGRDGHFLRDGLARGLRFGFCGGTDQHGLIWQHGVCWKRNAYRAGLTGVLAEGLTREAIFDALLKRRTFAATGVKLRPAFTAAGFQIGEEGKISKPPAIQADVLALEDIRWLTLVRNGEEILRWGGEGPRTRFSFTDEKIPEKTTSYYYLRIELRGGDMAWTSPIWLTPEA